MILSLSHEEWKESYLIDPVNNLQPMQPLHHHLHLHLHLHPPLTTGPVLAHSRMSLPCSQVAGSGFQPVIQHLGSVSSSHLVNCFISHGQGPSQPAFLPFQPPLSTNLY